MEPMPELKITIFTTEDCSKCKMLKMLLATKNIEFRDLDAIANWNSIKDLGFASAPIIKFEREGEEPLWFDDIQSFISYLEKNGLGI